MSGATEVTKETDHLITFSDCSSEGYAGDCTAADAYHALCEMGHARLLDVRTPPEWASVGYPDLTEIDKRNLSDQLAPLS